MNIIESIDGLGMGSIVPNSIVKADCLEAMKLIPDKSIDCIIADLPYGITACKWDIVVPFEPLWEQYKRIIKPNGAIALFGSQPFTSALVMSNPKWFKYEWIWEKSKSPSALLANKQPLRYHENILMFYQKQPNYIPQKTFIGIQDRRATFSRIKDNWKGHTDPNLFSQSKQDTGWRFPKSIIKSNNSNKTGLLAPTQKPVALIEYLIKTYSIEGELILDNTAGSGTLAIACINTNRRYICIEKDPDYFEVMRNRIENHAPNALVTPKKVKKPKAITEGQLALFG